MKSTRTKAPEACIFCILLLLFLNFVVVCDGGQTSRPISASSLGKEQDWENEFVNVACREGNVSAVIEAMERRGSCAVMKAQTSNVSFVGPKILIDALDRILGPGGPKSGPDPTCLHMAAMYGRSKLVKFLLEEGVDARER